MTNTPALREITAIEQASITESNKLRGQECKTKCGLYGFGARGALDYKFELSNRKQSKQDGSNSSTIGRLRKFNLHGEANKVIRYDSIEGSTTKNIAKLNQDKIGSI